MGGPMANNLLKKGHKLVVYDLVKASMDTAIAAGAVPADSPAQVHIYHTRLHDKKALDQQ